MYLFYKYMPENFGNPEKNSTFAAALALAKAVVLFYMAKNVNN